MTAPLKPAAAMAALLMALVAPVPVFPQSAAPDVLGLVGYDGSAHPFFSWNGTEWQSRTEDIPEGAPVVVVDSLGREFSAGFGAPIPGMPWIFGLNDFEAPAGSNRELGFRYVGYLSSPGVDHAPFQPVTSPISVDSWEALIASEVPERDQGAAYRLEVDVWTAQVEDLSFTFFVVTRQATSRQECVSRYQFAGVLDSGTSEPVVVTNSEGDCGGKGMISRRPMGLVMRAGRPALAVAFYDWDGFGVEVWGIVDGQIQVLGRESAN